MVDCGVHFSTVKEVLPDLKILLLSHSHSDHINISTIKKMQLEKPSLRIGCCEWMVPFLTGVRNIDVYEIGVLYNYVSFQISPIQLFHDIKNCGYRIFKDGAKILHATDTAHLAGISAFNYDLYALEANYDEETIQETIRQKELRGEFAHERGAINSHLSEQQCGDFFFENKGENSKLIRLHE
jgi:L-ascorbate metabolism protein UlaG (beta-lactamase superfamily)